MNYFARLVARGYEDRGAAAKSLPYAKHSSHVVGVIAISRLSYGEYEMHLLTRSSRLASARIACEIVHMHHFGDKIALLLKSDEGSTSANNEKHLWNGLNRLR